MKLKIIFLIGTVVNMPALWGCDRFQVPDIYFGTKQTSIVVE